MKSNSATISLRVKQLSSMLIQGCSREDIVQYCSENWNVSERQSDKYIQSARTLISETIKKDLEYEYAIAIQRFERILKLAEDKGDLKLMVQIIKEMTTLQGLHRVKIEHTGNIEFLNNIPE